MVLFLCKSLVVPLLCQYRPCVLSQSLVRCVLSQSLVVCVAPTVGATLSDGGKGMGKKKEGPCWRAGHGHKRVCACACVCVYLGGGLGMAINLASTPPPPAGMLLQCWYPITMLANPHVCAPRTPSVRLFARVRPCCPMHVCVRALPCARARFCVRVRVRRCWCLFVSCVGVGVCSGVHGCAWLVLSHASVSREI